MADARFRCDIPHRHPVNTRFVEQPQSTVQYAVFRFHGTKINALFKFRSNDLIFMPPLPAVGEPSCRLMTVSRQILFTMYLCRINP